MERVFPIDVASSSLELNIKRTEPFSSIAKTGVIEKVLRPGVFFVLIADGVRLRVSGSHALREGDKVQVLMPVQRSNKVEEPLTSDLNTLLGRDGIHWNAFMPLGFGGEKAEAKLEVFVEKEMNKKFEKTAPAIYFVFSVRTEKQGEIQWSVYLRRRLVALQVYAAAKNQVELRLESLIRTVEKSLE